jgi:hypothetical protein
VQPRFVGSKLERIQTQSNSAAKKILTKKSTGVFAGKWHYSPAKICGAFYALLVQVAFLPMKLPVFV